MDNTLSLLLQAQAIFAHDRYASKTTGIIIEDVILGDDSRCGVATCSLHLQSYHRNAVGNVMGGVLFTLADFTFAVASNLHCLSLDSALHWCTLDSTIHYLTTSDDDLLRAIAKPVRHGRTTCLYSISISDSHGRLLATVETTGIYVAATSICQEKHNFSDDISRD